MTRLRDVKNKIESGETPEKEDFLWAVTCLSEAMQSLFILRSAVESKATREEISDLVYKKLGGMLVALEDSTPIDEE